MSWRHWCWPTIDSASALELITAMRSEFQVLTSKDAPGERMQLLVEEQVNHLADQIERKLRSRSG